MGVDKHTYIGPYVVANKKPQKLKYENLACPDKKCRVNKKPSRHHTISKKFCEGCGSKIEMQTFYEDYYTWLGEILQENKIRGERLCEVDYEHTDKVKRKVVIITNVSFKHSQHFDEDENILCDFFGDKKLSEALGEFRETFDKELKIIHENYEDIEYCYGLVSWFS